MSMRHPFASFSQMMDSPLTSGSPAERTHCSHYSHGESALQHNHTSPPRPRLPGRSRSSPQTAKMVRPSIPMVRSYSVPVATQAQHDHQTATRSWEPTCVFQPTYTLMGLPLAGLPTAYSSSQPPSSTRSYTPSTRSPLGDMSSSGHVAGNSYPQNVAPLESVDDDSDQNRAMHKGEDASILTKPRLEGLQTPSVEPEDYASDFGFLGTKYTFSDGDGEDEMEMAADDDEGRGSTTSSSSSTMSRFNYASTSTLSTPGTITPTVSNYSLATTSIPSCAGSISPLSPEPFCDSPCMTKS